MSKRPTDGDEPPAKKRGNSRQLTKDDASDEENEERGTFQTATADQMKARRVVKARRGTGAPPPTPTAGVPAAGAAFNPFAGISLTGGLSGGSGNGFAALAQAAPATAEAPASEAQQPAAVNVTEEAAPTAAAAPEPEEQASEPSAATTAPVAIAPTPAASPVAPAFATFASTVEPFAATAGTGQLFNFGSVTQPKAGATTDGAVANGIGSTVTAADTPSAGAFSFATSASAGGGFSFKPAGGDFPTVQSIFGSSSAPAANGASEPALGQQDNSKPALASLPPETETVTGEEDEETLWSGEGTLYTFDANGQWRERGKGEMKINRGPGRPARFVMRQRGYLRLLMNAYLWPEMKVTPMDGGKGATFPVLNAVRPADEPGQDGAEAKLQTFAFRLKAAGQLDAFIAAINQHKAPVASEKNV